MLPETPTTETEYESAFQHGAASFANLQLSEMRAVVIPDGYKLENTESLLETPNRIRENVKLTRAESFWGYVNDFKNDGSLIFANAATRTFIAVLDYHRSDTEPRWGSHVATLSLPFSAEFTAWGKNDRKPLSQQDFAEWLEDRLIDVTEPEGAKLLTIASALEATKTLKFKSATRLDNGDSALSFEETTSGAVKIPATFTLGIPVFEGEEPIEIQCRLRYRIDGGLKFTYLMEDPSEIVRKRFIEIGKRIESETECQLVFGSRS